MRYSEITKKNGGSGFHLDNDKNAPDDAISVTQDQMAKAIEAISLGKSFSFSKKGDLEIIEPTPPAMAELMARWKMQAMSVVDASIRARRERVAGTSDPLEVAAWNNKLRIAQAIQAGAASDAEVSSFQREVDLRNIAGETLEDFTVKVIENAARFTKAVAAIDGIKRAAQDAIAAAQSQADIDSAIDSMREALSNAFGDAHAI